STKALLCYYAVAYVLIFTAAYFVAKHSIWRAGTAVKQLARCMLLNLDQY
mgnify:CR=1